MSAAYKIRYKHSQHGQAGKHCQKCRVTYNRSVIKGNIFIEKYICKTEQYAINGTNKESIRKRSV